MTFAELSNRVRRTTLVALLQGGFFIVTPWASLAAGTATLAWNPSASTNIIADYKVHYGAASGSYTNSISAGTNTTLTISGLVRGTTYYFAATAIDTFGLESDYSSEASALIPATGPNQPPTLDPLVNLIFSENAGPQIVNLSGITSGATNEAQTLVVTASSSNTGLIPAPAVSYTSPGTTGSITLNPVARANGVATITVTVNDGGASNNTLSRTFTATVLPVNQPPTLDALVDMTIDEDASLQTIALSGITSGATDETQTLTVTASSSNTGLIPNPMVSYTSPNTTGSISFTPVLLAHGSANITVTVNDGGTSNNIVSRTFTVMVSPVNHAPTLNPLTDLTLNENAALQIVSLTGIGSGSPNENQTLTVTASSSNTGVIPNPAVAYINPSTTGSIAFTPVTNASGSATITVTINDGGASNNIFSRTFAVTVNSVNQVPTLDPLADLTISENASQQTVSLSGISSGAANEAQALAVTASSDNTSLIPTPMVAYISPGASGSITFTPATNAYGQATVTVTVNDGGKSNNIVSRSFKVAVTQTSSRPAECVYALGMTNTTFSANATLGTFSVGTANYCTWSIVAPSWISLSSTNGSGAYTGTFSAEANTGASRVGQVTLLGGTTNVSCSLTQQAVAIGAVALATPLNGATLQTARPQFSWTLSDPVADKYYLMINRDESQYLTQWIEGATNWTSPTDLPAGNYSWAVEAANTNGTGPWSTNSSFAIAIQAAAVPNAVVLLSPSGSGAASGTQRFTWTADPAATRYELYIERDGAGFFDRWFNLADSVVPGTTGNFAVDVPGIANGTYLWWVRSSSPAGDGPWSDRMKVFLYRAP